MTSDLNQEHHVSNRSSWLRAAVMGANDGILSTASLIAGVAAANSDKSAIILAGVAGMIAGAMSMAAGEYVSVSSQADAEKQDVERERAELERNPEGELRELAQIYEERGLNRELAMEVAIALSEKDPLQAHLRDEIGITELSIPRPIQAGLVSAATFVAGALIPLLVAIFSAQQTILTAVYIGTLVALALLGALGAVAGGASKIRGALRVTLWGAIAMAATAGIGSLFDIAV